MSREKFGPELFATGPDKNLEKEKKMEQERMERIKQLLGRYDLEILNKIKAQREVRDKGIRFFHVLAKNQEGNERFVKMLASFENEEAKEAMRREVAVKLALKEQLDPKTAKSEFKTRPLIAGNADPDQGEVYFISEALPKREKILLIESEDDMEKLTPEHAQECVKTLLAMQKDIDSNKLIENIKKQFNLESMEDVYEILEDPFDDYEGYKENTLRIMSMQAPELSPEMDEDEKAEEIARSLENHGWPEDMDELLKEISPEYEQYLNKDKAEFGVMPLWMVMEKRLGTDDFRSKVEELFKKYEDVIKSFQQKDKYFFVHGDCCPRNTFYHDSGKVEFSDWGHAGVTKNELLALVYDYGNMRARAWNNKEYREAMDKAILEHYHSQGQEEAGKAVVTLGILRSHCCLAGFFENYDISKQREEQEKARKESTEQDVKKAFAIASIEL